MSSEPLVLLPPMMCDARIFYPQLSALSRDHMLIFPPTTVGERMEEIASQILMMLPQKFALAGMGMGGMVALEILRRVPDRVTRIALMATNAQADTPEYAATREPQIIAARAGRFADVIRAEVNPAFLSPGPQRNDIVAFVSDMAKELGPDVYVRQARAMQRRKDQQAVLRKIKQPALVLCGEDDAVNPVRRHEFMAEFIPYAKLEVIAGAGHLPTLEQPDLVTNALWAWMKQPLVLR